MNQPPPHSWDVDAEEARRIQQSLSNRLVLTGAADRANTVAGLDVSYANGSDGLAAAVVVFEVASLEPVDQAVVVGEVRFPYEPGLFAFRELPPLLDALAELQTRPDLLICDGQGYAHPRRFGLACHAGLLTGIPSIGCAKTPLVPTAEPVGSDRGQRTPMVDNGETVGIALRTRTDVKPVYVSPGHLVGFDEAADWVLRLAPRYRLPEPIRAADHLSRHALRKSTDG